MGWDGGGNHLTNRLCCGMGGKIAVGLSNIIAIFGHKIFIGIPSINTIVHILSKPAYIRIDVSDLLPEGPNVLGDPTGHSLKLVLSGVEAIPKGLELATNELQGLVNELELISEGQEEGFIMWVHDGNRGANVKGSRSHGCMQRWGTIGGNQGRCQHQVDLGE